MKRSLSDLAQQALKYAKSAGAEAADVVVVDGTTVSIEVRAGDLEHAERSEGLDLGLRVLVGQKQANISVSDVSAETLQISAERAVAMAKEAPDDPYCGLADTDELAQDWDASTLELADAQEPPTAEHLQKKALAAEAAALAVKGVDQTQGAAAGYSQNQIHLAISNGFSGGYARTSTSTSCVAIAGVGLEMERDYAGEARSHAADLPEPDTIGLLAGQRAVERTGAKQPPTGAYPVIFDERIAASLMGHLVAAINGSSIVRGSSWLIDALGETVLPKGLSLIEDPTRKRVAGSRPFDGEGLPVGPRALVQDGILQGWTLDLSTARKLGMKSTGNAARGVASPPSPSVGNLALTQGTDSRDGLIAQMGTGLVITSMIGSTISPTTGDYSRGASGFWVENGQVQRPVSGCTVAGNLRDMLKTIIPANDARGHLSRCVPSLLVEGLTIAGE